MSNKAYALLTGIFILVLTVAVIAAGIWMSGTHLATRPYIVVSTGNVAGLRPQSTVYFRGIAAGTVTSIHFDPSDPDDILIEVGIYKGIPITHATYATLALQGITGLSQLELVNKPGPEAKQLLPTSSRFPARIPLQPSLIDRLGRSSVMLTTQLGELAKSLNTLMNAKNKAHIQRLLAQADDASAMLLKLERDLDVAARRLPALGARTQKTLARVEHAADSISALTTRLNALTRTGQNAGHTLNRYTLPRLNTALDQIDQAAAEVHQLADSLRRDPQQLLLGPTRPAPGPGEPGYKAPKP